MSYKSPKDNSEHFKNVEEGVIHDYGTFDFIIVGAGSAGSVLTNRLSSISSWKILLLEAGDEGEVFVDIPALYLYLSSSKYNWGYSVTSQKYGCKAAINSSCEYARGKILGGSSSINGLMYNRGHPKDYDYWKQLGNPGWGFEDVEPFFRKMENAQFPAKNLGHSGPLYINYSTPVLPIQETFRDAFAEMGIFETEYNGENQIGTSRVESNIKHGWRVSGKNAYIKPALNRKNLNVTTKAFVTKVLIDNVTKIVRGVRFVRNGKTFDAFAKKEVILSAGAINSPQILMLSGVGPESLLRKYDIPLIKNLPVGKKLLEHTVFAIAFSSNLTQNKIPLSVQIEDFLKGEGLLTASNNIKCLGYMNKDYLGRPEFEFSLLAPTGGNSYMNKTLTSLINDNIIERIKNMDSEKYFSIFVELLHAKSAGHVAIRSNDPKDFPEIDLNMLSAEEDMEGMYKAVEILLDISKTEAFRKINASMYFPFTGCSNYERNSKKYWYCIIQNFSLPGNHAMGTTSMGYDPRTSVVNHELKVHGIGKLRVGDCGIIPATITGHTNGPAFMIGEKLSSMIKKEYMPKSNM
ncbi:hypothetical protein HHI36_020192 [Cryptolaemus montrouzieri]|uniref:Glucose-methanol-choline oxidoreductase N-terminal domain-containing protein n=1 Tax=Cryptolaemus montrouzieri TaxID=559131 RepID=A0ABD2N9S7_9CUCU